MMIRQTFGDVVVTCLPDGVLHENAGVLTGIPGDRSATLRAGSLDEDFDIRICAFLVQAGNETVLIDAGCGDAMGPDAGRLPDSLKAAGVEPGDVGLVLLTHMHPDHVGGLLNPDGSPRFANARVVAPDGDAAVFLSESAAAAAPEAARPVFARARALAAAYGDRFTTLAASGLPAGVSPVPLPGHSPGHTGYRISGGGRSLLVWGDVVHVPALQFAHPGIGMIFDADPDLAQRTRRDAFAAAAASGEMVAGMHLHPPGLGRVAVSSTGYELRPESAG